MKIKLLLLSLAVIFSLSCVAQSPFKPLPKPGNHYNANAKASIVIVDTLPAGSTYVGLRFTGPMVLYVLPNSTVFTGVGIDYEHDTYSQTTGKFYCDWAFAVAVYAGGQFAPTNVSGVTGVGFSVQLFNKLLSVGVLYNLTTKQVQSGVGPGVATAN